MHVYIYIYIRTRMYLYSDVLAQSEEVFRADMSLGATAIGYWPS